MRIALGTRSQISGTAALVTAILLPAVVSAAAITSATLTRSKVSIVAAEGQTEDFTLASVEGAVAFDGLQFSAGRRYAGWEVEKNAIPDSAPVPLRIIIVGPHSEVRLSVDQPILRWRFEDDRRVRVCVGPMHGLKPETCRRYDLPK